jgi:hypothetical protein
MELHIYDVELNRLGVIDEITSFIWIRRYSASGEFKLLLPHTQRHMDLLKMNRLLIKGDDSEPGIIRHISIRENTQGVEELEISGKFASSWLKKRIVFDNIDTTDNLLTLGGYTIPELILRIVGENVTSPVDTHRTIPNIKLPEPSVMPLPPITIVPPHQGIFPPYIPSPPRPGIISSRQVDYAVEEFANVLDAVEGAAKASSMGFGIYADVFEKTFTFILYEGRDLTSGNPDNVPCIFSKEFDNVHKQELLRGMDNLRTAAYVGGEVKENTARRIVEVNAGVTGHDREELFVNASDLRQTYRDHRNRNRTIPLPQYLEMLYQRGEEELANHTETFAFESEINTRSNLVYKSDYDLGDLVTCFNKEWDVSADVRITEVQEIYQDGIAELIIIFGEDMPTLTQVVKQLTNKR